MFFLRFAAVVALAVWIGGLVTLGIAAATIFHVLETHDPATGRELGGLVFGGVFQQFQHVAWGLAAAFFASLGARAALGPRPRRLAIRLWTGVLMLAISLATVFVATPRIDRIRASVSGPIANLADDDARKVEFGRLHGLTNGLMLLSVFAGLGLLWAEIRDSH